MSADSLQQAKTLIQQKRYDEARQILQRLNVPKAKVWLSQLDEIAPVKQKPKDDYSDLGDPFANQPQRFQQHIPTQMPPQMYRRLPKPRNDLEIIVTTADLPVPYDVIGPVYFQVSNKGIFSSPLSKLKKHYWDEIRHMRQSGTMSRHSMDWLGLFEGTSNQTSFEIAFLISTRELQKRARFLGGDAVIGMRQDIDIDTSGWQHFYLQMYGTVVRFV